MNCKQQITAVFRDIRYRPHALADRHRLGRDDGRGPAKNGNSNPDCAAA